LKPYNKSRFGVSALPATQAGAEYAAEHGCADSVRGPAVAVKSLENGRWELPGGSLVIVDDADHLDPGLLGSLVGQAATRTNAKLLLLITNYHGVDHATTAPRALTRSLRCRTICRGLDTSAPQNTETRFVTAHSALPGITSPPPVTPAVPSTPRWQNWWPATTTSPAGTAKGHRPRPLPHRQGARP
jgi:hypothetical protein